MSETLPTTQSGSIAATTPGRRPVHERKQPQNEDFNTAFARQKADHNPKLNVDPRGTSHQQNGLMDATLNAGSTKQAEGDSLRSKVQLRSRLPEPAHRVPPDQRRETGRDDLSSKDDTQSALSALLPPQTGGSGPDPSIIAQFLSISTPPNFDHPVSKKELHTKLPESSDDSVAAHINASVLDAEFDVKYSIADTPVTVREQQTHFARDPLGRSGFTTAHHGPERQITTQAHGAPSRGLAEALAKTKEAPQPTSAQANRIIDPKSDASAEHPSTTIQLLGKILEACDEQFGTTQSPAPSAPLHSTERPFGSMMRLLRIELSPASLGIVHVTLKGAHAALSISIETERSQTAASLGADRSSLSTRLTEAGYAIDELVVKTIDRPLDAAPPNRPDPTLGSSGNALAAGSDDSQRRQADDSWRRPDSEQNRHAQAATQHTAQTNEIEKIGSPTAWRGRHITRSV
ncbi:MAG: flagellar hook-length control protein FliK [Hyphomicrobiaceae bacterium]